MTERDRVLAIIAQMRLDLAAIEGWLGGEADWTQVPGTARSLSDDAFEIAETASDILGGV